MKSFNNYLKFFNNFAIKYSIECQEQVNGQCYDQETEPNAMLKNRALLIGVDAASTSILRFNCGKLKIRLSLSVMVNKNCKDFVISSILH